MSSTELNVTDILSYFFEEFFSDRIYEDDEKDIIVSLRRELNIPYKIYLEEMKKVNDKFLNNEIQFKKRDYSNDYSEIYKKILKKAFSDRVITKEEERLILGIAKVLNISNSKHKEIKAELNLNTDNKEVSNNSKTINSEKVIDETGKPLDDNDIIAFLEMGSSCNPEF